MGREIITKSDAAKIATERQELAQFRQQQGAVAGSREPLAQVSPDEIQRQVA